MFEILILNWVILYLRHEDSQVVVGLKYVALHKVHMLHKIHKVHQNRQGLVRSGSHIEHY